MSNLFIPPFLMRRRRPDDLADDGRTTFRGERPCHFPGRRCAAPAALRGRDDNESSAREVLLCCVLEGAGLDLSWKETVSPLGDGFCNWVYRINGLGTEGTSRNVGRGQIRSSSSVVVKVYSPLGKIRVEPEVRGTVDQIASDIGVGPQLFYSSQDGIVTKFINGDLLTEDDVHGRQLGDGRSLCKDTASQLARLHLALARYLDCVTTPSNVLWHTLDRMLTYFRSEPCQFPDFVAQAGWTLDRITSEVCEMQTTIESLLLPTALVHGDLKPSNVLARSWKDGADPDDAAHMLAYLVFIDFELSGLGYRGYDICKFFFWAGFDRTNFTRANMEAFASSYLDELQRNIDDFGGKALGSSDVSLLLAEAMLFEPLTWLEPVVFFLFAIKGDPLRSDRWAELASDRLQGYEVSKAAFSSYVDLYQRGEFSLVN